MTPRERVKKALSHSQPDRVPADVGGGASTSIVLGGYIALCDYLNIQYETPIRFQSFVYQIVELDEKVMEALGSDCRPLLARPAKYRRAQMLPGNKFMDEWGVIYWKPEGILYYEVNESPLKEADISALGSYPWPDPYDPGRTEGLEEEAKWRYENTPFAIVGNAGAIDIWQRAVALRGFEQMLMDLVINKEFAHALFSIIVEFNKAIFEQYLKKVGKYIDVIRLADDLASQNSLLMSPETYREMLKPYHQDLINFIKSRTDAKVFFHSCGNIYPLIPDLIEIGVDILNPVQVAARDMSDTARLKEEFGDKICFWGAIDTQHVLPFGSEEEVVAEVKRRLKDLAPGGGYVLAAVHNIQPEVPPENVLAMCQTAKRYGIYPINL